MTDMGTDDATPVDGETEGASRTLRIVVADDNALLREGIASLLVEAGVDRVVAPAHAPRLALLVQGTHVTGEPEFYQYASIGGSQNMRGFVRDRFWGQTGFYNTNELRWITNFRTYIMNGKIGLIGFVDDGRVWMPNENSDVWHVGYGGGVLLAPFNKFALSVSYGISDEDQLIHLRINKLLFDN